MKGTFQNRMHAGRLLAPWLRSLAGRLDVIVLALPRGGVPVAAAVAERLAVPLDVLCVRKLGVPGHEELAMGAIASGAVLVRNEEIIAAHRIPERELERAVARERSELERRERVYRGDRPQPALKGRIVVLVDDGIATGATMLAAIRAARRRGASRVVVATPVAAREAVEALRGPADEVFTVLAPETLFAIGEFYEDFRQTTDAEVVRLLAAGAQPALNHP